MAPLRGFGRVVCGSHVSWGDHEVTVTVPRKAGPGRLMVVVKSKHGTSGARYVTVSR